MLRRLRMVVVVVVEVVELRVDELDVAERENDVVGVSGRA